MADDTTRRITFGPVKSTVDRFDGSGTHRLAEEPVESGCPGLVSVDASGPGVSKTHAWFDQAGKLWARLPGGEAFEVREPGTVVHDGAHEELTRRAPRAIEAAAKINERRAAKKEAAKRGGEPRPAPTLEHLRLLLVLIDDAPVCITDEEDEAIEAFRAYILDDDPAAGHNLAEIVPALVKIGELTLESEAGFAFGRELEAAITEYRRRFPNPAVLPELKEED